MGARLSTELLVRSNELKMGFGCTDGGDELYDAFAAEHGRRHGSLAEYEHRRSVFHSNRQLVEAHNAQNGRNFTLGINRFADWTQVCLPSLWVLFVHFASNVLHAIRAIAVWSL